MKKNDIEKIKENLTFVLQAINAPISFEISLVNQFDDTDNYEIIKTNSELPLYKLIGKNRYSEWATIFSLGEKGKTYNRLFDGYREFLSLIEKEESYCYSFVIIHIPIDEYSKIGYDLVKADNTEWSIGNNYLTFIDYLIDDFLQAYQSLEMIAYKDIIDVLEQIDIRFDNPINLMYHKKIRKLLEIAKDDIYLIGASWRSKLECTGIKRSR